MRNRDLISCWIGIQTSASLMVFSILGYKVWLDSIGANYLHCDLFSHSFINETSEKSVEFAHTEKKTVGVSSFQAIDVWYFKVKQKYSKMLNAFAAKLHLLLLSLHPDISAHLIPHELAQHACMHVYWEFPYSPTVVYECKFLKSQK